MGAGGKPGPARPAVQGRACPARGALRRASPADRQGHPHAQSPHRQDRGGQGMSADVLQALLEVNLAAAVSIAFVLLVRKPAHHLMGSRAVYLLWAIVPIA